MTGTPGRVDPNRGDADFGGQRSTFQILALEGRGVLRVQLSTPAGPAELQAGEDGLLVMHDGARFRVRVSSVLQGPGAYRLTLTGQDTAGDEAQGQTRPG